MKRSGHAIWNGAGPTGNGKLTTQSGALKDLPYDFKGRFQSEDGRAGTNPEELLGASHAGCFSMAFAFALGGAGFTPEEIKSWDRMTADVATGIRIENGLIAIDVDVDDEDIVEAIADKLIARHPYVFADADVPDDLLASWEQRKRAEKGRTSALDGIPDRMSALTRAGKVLARAGSHGVPVSTDASAADIGERMLALVVEANDQGIDAEQATRASVRRLEQRIVQAESTAG